MILTGEQIEKRRAVCMACPHLRTKPINYCSACGCPIASKTRLRASACPKGKWERVMP